MSKITSLLVVVCAVWGMASFASAQQMRLPSAIAQSQSMENIRVTSGDSIQMQQAIAANQQRQVEIRRDTEKLAELTEELKAYLQKADQGVMSLDAIKKAEQIEKLAKSVKSKMKLSF